MHDGRLVGHSVTAGARLEGAGVVYDIGADQPLPDLNHRADACVPLSVSA